MRILIDIDGTIADTLPHWLEAIARNTGVRATEADIYRWELQACPPLDTLAIERVFEPLQTPGFMASVPVIPGAPEAIRGLRDRGHDVYLVTARMGPVSVPETLEWRARHLPDLPESKLIFCHDKHLITADALVDDRQETLVRYRQHHPGARLATIAYRYNEGLIGKVYRVPKTVGNPWKFITDYLESR